MDGMGWDGMGWDGMGWDGMGWAVHFITEYSHFNLPLSDSKKKTS
jgi:hypothetical protein